MRHIFHPEAGAEAVDYYEERRKGLGRDFATEVYSAIERIAVCPKAWTAVENGIRRCLVRRFPYGVIYSERGDKIYILAVMHLRRNPDYWKHRIQ
jgi:hypothetical protein